MNSYQLISKLRKVRGRIYLTTAAQALYHELVAICNDMKWKEVFFIRSNILCGNLDISDNTLRKSRDSLSDAGLLFYRTCKDKRIGCYYSFSQKISDDVLSSATSSAIIEDESTDDNADDNANESIFSVKTDKVVTSAISSAESPSNFEDDKKASSATSSAIIEDESTDDNADDNANESIFSVKTDKVVTSAISSAESPSNFEDDKKASSATSSAIIEDETQIPPIIDIKTINKESLARTHENPPPEKPKKSRKKEGDVKPLVYPFSSIAFMSAWETLRNTPKWKNKLNYALQLSLNKLSNFEEEFAIRQIERAIESGWTGVVFTGTERDYQEWLNIKYGKTGIQGQNNRNADKAAKARMLLDEYAAIEQGNSAINHQAEIPDL